MKKYQITEVTFKDSLIILFQTFQTPDKGYSENSKVPY